MAKWIWDFIPASHSEGLLHPGENLWRLQCGDSLTQIFALTKDAGVLMADLLSYESAAPYAAVESPAPGIVPNSVVFRLREDNGITHAPQAIAIAPEEVATDERATKMAEMASGHVRRLNHAADVPADVRADAMRPVDPKAAAAAAEQIFETAKAETKLPPMNRASRVEAGEHPQQLNIPACYACDGEHIGLDFHTYKTPNPPYTHWYACPRTGDPVGLALMTNPAGELVELHNGILQRLAIAQASGKFMVAIFHIKDKGDGKKALVLSRVSHDFPRDDYFFKSQEQPGCVDTLRRNLEEERGPMEPERPLQPAMPAPRPTLGNFFGGAGFGGVMTGDGYQPQPMIPPEDQPGGIPDGRNEIPRVPVAD